MKIVGALLAVLLLGWAAVHWLPRKARPGPEAGVARAFWGLQLFGKSGAFVAMRHVQTGGGLRFQRLENDDAGTTLQLQFVSVAPSPESLRRFAEQAALAGVLIREDPAEAAEQEPTVLLGELGAVHRGAWEAVARSAAEAAGWRWSDNYRVEFGGPKDYARVDEFFGFKSRRRR